VTVEPGGRAEERIEMEAAFLTGSAAAMGHAQQSCFARVARAAMGLAVAGGGVDLNPIITGLSAEVKLDTDWTPT
jgi:hypothetical protein